MIQKNNSYGRDQFNINNPQGDIFVGKDEPLREIIVLGIDAIPPSLKDWVDREDVQHQLRQYIKSQERLVGISGLSGFGKSTLAAWGFHCLSADFSKALWINLPKEILFSQFARWVLQEIGYKVIGDQHTDQDLALELLIRLREKPYLIVIDQLETLLSSAANWESYKAFLVDWLNRGDCSKLLFTTRHQICSASCWITLNGLNSRQVIQMFTKFSIIYSNTICVERLTVATDGHPLLLNFVITWLRQEKEKLGHVDLTIEDVIFFENIFQHYETKPEAKVEDVFKDLFHYLPAKLRTLLLEVSVYRDPFNLEGIQTLVPTVIEEDLQELCDKHFLLARPEDKRWVLHPLIKKLVYEKLKMAGNHQAVHQKAGIFFSKNVNIEKNTPEDCTAELEAFYHFCESESYVEANYIIESCAYFLNQCWGGYGILIPLYKYLSTEWLNKKRVTNSLEERLYIVIALVHLGDAYHGGLKYFNDAVCAYEEAYHLLSNIKYSSEKISLLKVNLLHRLARVHCALGDHHSDIDCSQRALDISINIEDKRYELSSVRNLISAFYNSKNIDQFSFNKQSLEDRFQEIRHKYPEAYDFFFKTFGKIVNFQGRERELWSYGRYIISLKSEELFSLQT